MSPTPSAEHPTLCDTLRRQITGRHEDIRAAFGEIFGQIPSRVARGTGDNHTRYEQLKRDLAQAHGADLMAYARNKDDFVNEVLGVRDKTEAPLVGAPQRP
ncbi:GrpB family protein [Dactylosporangium sp. NBC_01737]|uniref:hypothetical protein n=1 Tax=Dactylosporangium sp. NBC_01737 TaxID=2975959 RepID=UPI003FA3B89E|nr:GrpB family protein [Dactylosporangium sp. NBC_01737]